MGEYDEETLKREHAKNALERYMHYYQRWCGAPSHFFPDREESPCPTSKIETNSALRPVLALPWRCLGKLGRRAAEQGARHVRQLGSEAAGAGRAHAWTTVRGVVSLGRGQNPKPQNFFHSSHVPSEKLSEDFVILLENKRRERKKNIGLRIPLHWKTKGENGGKDWLRARRAEIDRARLSAAEAMRAVADVFGVG
jgi:hypothetical protein